MRHLVLNDITNVSSRHYLHVLQKVKLALFLNLLTAAQTTHLEQETTQLHCCSKAPHLKKVPTQFGRRLLLQWTCVNNVFLLIILTCIFFLKNCIRKGKEAGLYQNKVNLSLTFTQRLGHSAHNCKMAYLSQYH